MSLPAVLDGCLQTDSTDSDGDISTSYHYYVRYTDQGGVAREAVLTNTYTRRNLVPGDYIRIKFLPGKENAAVMVNTDSGMNR